MDLASELKRYGPDAPPVAISVADARAYCRNLALGHYENFTVVSFLVPRHLRQHICNLYGYCRWADDLADEAGDSAAPELLKWWEGELDALYAGKVTHPVFVALAETVREFELPRQPLADLLIAFRRDQTQRRYETLADLLTYCEKSANPVGRIVLCLGRSATNENFALSDSICTGQQLANFCQDVRRDWEIGRIYLPQDLCRRQGWDEARFAAGRCDEAFRQLLAELVDRAEAFLRQGEPLRKSAAAELRPAISLFIGGTKAILAAIRRARYDVWSRRPTVGRLTKLRLLFDAWRRR